MRIISGEYKGHTISAPRGDNTRPTTDRVRESIMSSIVSIIGAFEGTYALDAFAGSGACGLEAISRGASSCVFCDMDLSAIRAIKDNISSLGLTSDNAKVMHMDVMKHGLPRTSRPYDLLFLDPPYRFSPTSIFELIDTCFRNDSLTKDCLIVYEHDEDANASIDDLLDEYGLGSLKRKKYGTTYVDYIQVRR